MSRQEELGREQRRQAGGWGGAAGVREEAEVGGSWAVFTLPGGSREELKTQGLGAGDRA